MPKNPLATPDQIAVELQAARLLQRADVQAARAHISTYWREAVKPDAEQFACFDFEFEQAIFCSLMAAANADAQRPRIHAFGRFAHETGGVCVPATKGANANPDYIYRFMPVSATSRHSIRCRPDGPLPAALEYALMTHNQATVKNISRHEFVFEEDGSILLTIDPDPAGGRPNHFQTTPDTHQMVLRDILADTATEVPLALAIEREDTPAEHSDDAVAAIAPWHMRKFVDDLLWIADNLIFTTPANAFEPPIIRRDGVYSIAQAYSTGHYQVADDQALIFTLSMGGAAYAVVPITNIWGGTGRCGERQNSLGTGAALADADGRYSFVLSHRDPGVHNWIDPDGLHNGVIFLRWIGFDPAIGDGTEPTLETRLVTFDALAGALPPGVARIDPPGRARQLATRWTNYRNVMG